MDILEKKPIQKEHKGWTETISVEETNIYSQGIQDIRGCFHKTVSMKSYFHELAIIKGESMANGSLLMLLKETLLETEKKSV